MPEISIDQLNKDCARELGLEWVAGAAGGGRQVRVGEVNRPGLSLAGYFEHFRSERIQIFGQGEYAFLQTLDNARRMEMIGRLFSFKDLPAAIITHGREVSPEIVDQGNANQVPVFRSRLTTAHLIRELSAYLESRLAPSTIVHGVLTVVYGLGVLIVGDSGAGKSECGLELVKRGHMLVSDDYVEVRHHPGDLLIGSGGAVVRHFMEVRGLGIIDVKKIFGVTAVKDAAKVELVVRLEAEQTMRDFDRIGLENRTTTILDVSLPEIVLPLRPGRNVAVILEVAALNHRLKQEGIYSARELNDILIARMAKDQTKSGTSATSI